MSQSSSRKGRRPFPVEPTPEELETLERWARGRTVSVQLAQRAKLILLCAEGMGTTAVSKEIGLSAPTVSKWRKRFSLEGINSLHDRPRPKDARKLGDEEVEEVLRATIETTPKGQTHWSTRQLAKKLGVSQSSVSRIWRAFKLKPHLHETFRLSNDDFFVEKVRDVVGLYMSPPANALVLCVDEKSQIQALERGQPVIPMLVGQPERRTPQYLRHGTTTLFAALNVATGEVIGECHAQHRAIEFRKFLNKINRSVPKDLEVHIILDNYATHSAPEIQRWLQRHRRFHFHFIPTYSCWLNQVERWFGLLTQRALRRGVHRSTAELKQAIRQYIAAHNADPKPFVWTKSADKIIASVTRHCQRIQDIFGQP